MKICSKQDDNVAFRFHFIVLRYLTFTAWSFER